MALRRAVVFGVSVLIAIFLLMVSCDCQPGVNPAGNRGNPLVLTNPCAVLLLFSP